MPVNLSGIEPSGTAIGAPRKSSTGPEAGPTAAAPTQQGGPAQDGVSITSTAALLAEVEQSLGARPAVDQSRVDALRQAIEAGTYRIEPQKVADGLIHTERALGPLPRAEL